MPSTVRSLAAHPVTQAMVTRLDTASVKTIATGGVFNDVPEGTARPYVLVMNASEQPWNTMGAWGSELMQEVHAYSDYEGDLVTAQILEEVVRALDHRLFPVPGYVLTSCQFEQILNLEPVVERGITSRHRVGMFRVRVQES